jgi:hypothetical protein
LEAGVECDAGICEVLVVVDGGSGIVWPTPDFGPGVLPLINIAVSGTTLLGTSPGNPMDQGAPALDSYDLSGLRTDYQLTQAAPWGIAANEVYAYFTDPGTPGASDGAVMIMPIPDGGPYQTTTPPIVGGLATVLAAGQDLPWAITIDSTSIYWTNRSTAGTSNGSIMKMPLAGGASQLLASGQASPYGIAVDASNIYWVNQGSVDGPNGSVVKVGLDGGSPVVIASSQSAPWGIAVSSSGVYWTNYGGGTNSGSVMAAPLDGGAPYALATGQNFPCGIAVDSTSVYWANFGNGLNPGTGSSSDGTIMTANLDGTNLTTLMAGLQGPEGIAVGVTSVFFACLGGQGGFWIVTPK